MDRPHDRGGMPAGPIDTTDHELAHWEKNTHALFLILARDLGLIKGGRQAIEKIPSPDYERFSYYERWIAAMESQLIETGILTKSEIDKRAKELEDV